MTSRSGEGRWARRTGQKKGKKMVTILRKTWLQMTTVAIAAAVIQPGILSAQNSGVGGDGNTRLLWRGTDNHISLWRIDSALNYQIFHEYGPYFGYEPIAITTANNNNTYVLWRHTSGKISLWVIDANLNFLNFREYGPYEGWIAESLSVETPGSNRFRLIWRDTDGRISVWLVDSALNLVNNHAYGPYFGYVPSAGPFAVGRKLSDDQSDKQAASAMAKSSSDSVGRMPEQ
jgi:hypothetical protein